MREATLIQPSEVWYGIRNRGRVDPSESGTKPFPFRRTVREPKYRPPADLALCLKLERYLLPDPRSRRTWSRNGLTGQMASALYSMLALSITQLNCSTTSGNSRI